MIFFLPHINPYQITLSSILLLEVLDIVRKLIEKDLDPVIFRKRDCPRARTRLRRIIIDDESLVSFAQFEEARRSCFNLACAERSPWTPF